VQLTNLNAVGWWMDGWMDATIISSGTVVS